MNLSTSKSSNYVNLIVQKFDRQVHYKCHPPIQKSASASGIIESNRGFKPSDRHDPCKKKFLMELSQKIWHVSADENSGRDNKPIDLEKLFTPATDSGEVTPRNRKMYASSSFYSSIHPTVEDQVELARRISSSLCDISNKQSKGQSMYVNRMKRSVKWVHGGEESKEIQDDAYISTNNESNVLNHKYSSCDSFHLNNPKISLKLVMNPHGKVQDINSLTKQGLIIQPPLSPELCFDLVRDLNTTKGKGAELFAKRRKKSEKWVVDENTVKQICSAKTVQRQTSKCNTENVLAPSQQQKEEQMQKIHEIKERFNQPKLKLVKSPWEAALETGSVDAAFQQMEPSFPKLPIPWIKKVDEYSSTHKDPRKTDQKKLGGFKNDLYMPNIPKGWTSVSECSIYESLKADPKMSMPSSHSKSSVDTTFEPHQFQQKMWDFSGWNNYNTAPRGWKQDLDYYRPVTFTPSYKMAENKYYSDF